VLADSLSPHVTASLACVLEAAQTSAAIAIGATADVGATIVLVTRATVTSCPALSRVGDDIYVATIGGGVLAADRAHSMLEGATWDRARPYLLREPLALAAELPATRIIAVAQPEPLDAWLTIDAADPDALGKRVEAQLAHWPNVLAAKLRVSRNGTQIAIGAEGLVAEDLVKITSDLLAAAEAPPPTPVTDLPQQFKATSVPALLRELAAARSAPLIEAGEIVGIRLLAAVAPLRVGDVILGVESQRIVDSAQLGQLAGALGDHVTLAVRRDGIDATVELVEGSP
jgi:hypothetical protein